jgi:threonine/homoserine/homoserine lactone efflux protein
MLTALFVPFLITTFLIELTPGPNMAWLALTSATHGWRAGLAAVAGISLGLALMGATSAFGLAALVTRSPYVFSILRYAGVAYLLWLAWQAWVGEKEIPPGTTTHNAQLAAWFKHGLLLNVLNPKAAVFFIAVLPSYIVPNQAFAAQTILLTACYIVIATAVHCFIIVMSGRAHNWLSSGSRQHMIRRMFALLLAFIALWFLFSTR